ncbi:hypothetical protein BTIS_0073 [Bifidobacterium tissieri]|uniref:Uncharacterized protein n=1 Tax=Bifidobacterium tissieri TaxID=1630162 RepID=A0A261FJK8_9BIFI|nr:hypothetical protein [Bifidobacterium tissieri]OZG59342.1 hypothetical protein BTIS_0073 [Bifidobacterium tissieri]
MTTSTDTKNTSTYEIDNDPWAPYLTQRDIDDLQLRSNDPWDPCNYAVALDLLRARDIDEFAAIIRLVAVDENGQPRSLEEIRGIVSLH